MEMISDPLVSKGTACSWLIFLSFSNNSNLTKSCPGSFLRPLFHSHLQGAHGLKGNEGPPGPPGPAVSTIYRIRIPTLSLSPSVLSLHL